MASDATVFDLAPGTQQGRIRRAEGGFAFELGHAARAIDLAQPGDTVSVAQDVVDESAAYLRMHVRVHAPDPRPGGEGDEWLFTASRSAGGEEVLVYSRVIPADGVVRELRDIVIVLRGAGSGGPVTMRYALTLLGKAA